MDHLVRFNTAAGREAQHVADSLPEALKFVERLRNSEDVADVRVFRMQEVPISFRTYYKVEVSTDGEDAAGPVAVEPRVAAPVGVSAAGVAPGSSTAQGSAFNGQSSPQLSPAGEGHSEGGRRLFSR